MKHLDNNATQPDPLPSADEVLNKCWCDDHRCSKVQGLQAEAKAALAKDLLDIVGEDMTDNIRIGLERYFQ